jgi:putative ABC transport system ATP-binding protein
VSTARATATVSAPARLGTISVLRRGWRTSPELRAGAGATLGLSFIAAGGRVVVPVLVQQLLDRGLHHGVGTSTYWALTGAGVAAVIVTAFAAAATRRRLAWAGESALCGLRTRAFRHIHRLSLATQSDERRGVLVSRVTSDIETLSQFLSWAGVAWLVNITVMAVVVVVMTLYDWRLALIALAVVVPMGLVLSFVQKRLSVAYDLVRQRVGEMLAAVSEAVLGHHVIRSYGAHEQSGRRLEDAIESSRKANVRAGVISAFLFPSGDVFSVLTVAAVLVLGVVLGPAGGLTVGKLVAFLFLTNLFLEPIAEFTEIIDNTQTAVAGWRKVLDVLDTPVDVPEPDPGIPLPPGPPRIEIDGVSFSYGATRVLHDVSAAIPAGCKAAIVGATGSGKTTLAKLLTRLADPDEGRILIGGVDLRDAAAPSLRRALVLVPQEGFLFDTTIGDNVRFGQPHATDDDVRRAFAELGLSGWLASLPRGLDTPVGQRGEHLSVGERQLVSLARASIANPTCLILDEATSAVDPATEVAISRAVESLSRGRTSVTIAHRLATAERADLVLVMDGGRLVEQGTHDDLVRGGGVYARLHRRWVAGVAPV